RGFGFGSKTTIDLDEAKGVVPDAEWKRAFVRHQAKLGVAPYKTKAKDYINWNPGDNILLGVGQGDLLVTPLQLADAYATFANGCTVFRPPVVDQIFDTINATPR